MILRKWYRFIFTAILAVFGAFVLQSQDATISLPYTHYTVADGLAQMQIRSLYADDEGLVWIGTQGGISLYDGSAVHTFQDIGPLAEEYVLSLVRGSNRLYVSTIKESYWFDGVDVTSIGATPSQPDAYVLFEDARHNVWFNGVGGLTILTPEQGFKNLTDVYPELGELGIEDGWGHPTWGNCFLLDRKNRFYTFNPGTGNLLIDSLTFSPDDALYISPCRSADKQNLIIHRRAFFEGELHYTTDLFRLYDDRLLHVASLDRESGRMLSISPHAPIGFLGRVNGVRTFFILRDTVYDLSTMPLFGNVHNMIESGHKLYLSTDAGLVVIHGDGLENVSFPVCDYPWSVMPGDDDDIYVGCYKSGIFHLSADGHLLQHYAFPLLTGRDGQADQVLTNYLVSPNVRLWGSGSGFLFLKDGAHSLGHTPTWYSTEALAIDLRDQSIFAASDTIYHYLPDVITRTDTIFLEDSLSAGGCAHDLTISKNRYLWVAAPGGIKRIHLDTNQSEIYTKFNGKLPCHGAVTIEEDEAGNIWSGGTCGLMVHWKGSKRFEFVLPEIIKQRVNQVTILPDNRLVCASNNTLYILDIRGNAPSIVRIYNRKNGLHLYEPSENGNSVTQNRFVWLPSVSGIQRLDLKRMPMGMYPAKLLVTGINSKAVRFLNNVSDTLAAIGYAALLDLTLVDHSGREWQYQFSLNGGKYSPWQSSGELLVSGLGHGLNAISIRAAWNHSDPMTYIETDIYVSTSLPFLNRKSTQYFLIGFITILGIATLLIMMRSQRHARYLSRLRSDLYRNRLRTIQAYLNPHFLFNTLTRIQDHILHHDAVAGNDMIVRLARVFRKVLDIGKYEEDKIPTIRLSEELALIKDIVYLNNELVSVPFDFLLDVDPEILAYDPLIPPMLIQPFVENAFKHAFRGSENEKIIKVIISGNKQSINIFIEDNGIGFDGLPLSKDKSSIGMELARERMELLNALAIENQIEITGLSPRGTRVEIHIKPLF